MCDPRQLETSPETLRQCLQHNVDEILPAVGRSRTLVSQLESITHTINDELRRHNMPQIPNATAVTLPHVRLRIRSLVPFRLEVLYPKMVGKPQRLVNNRGRGAKADAVARSNHDICVILTGNLTRQDNTLAFTQLEVHDVTFIINDFVAEQVFQLGHFHKDFEESLSMSKTTLNDPVHVPQQKEALRLETVFLEIFQDPSPARP